MISEIILDKRRRVAMRTEDDHLVWTFWNGTQELQIRLSPLAVEAMIKIYGDYKDD